MSENSRKNIFERLQNAFGQNINRPFPEVGENFAFEKNETDLTALFIKNLNALGVCSLVVDRDDEIINSLKEIFRDKKVRNVSFEDSGLEQFFRDVLLDIDESVPGSTAAVTACSQLIAKTGSILVKSSQIGGRLYNISPDIHIVIATENQIVYNINEALDAFDYNDIPSMLCFISGASRTADIEKTLVMGAHGPKELYVFIKK